MRLDRRLTLIGIMLVVLSMTMATQYATTKVNYSYSIVHPSNADIRFIASDNSSDNKHLLRVSGNTSGNRVIELKFGNWTENINKTWTAAFGIVNEEQFAVNITHINVSRYDSAAESDYMQIWLHSNRRKLATAESPSRVAFVWNKGSSPYARNASSCAWQLASGNGNPQNMDGSNTETRWNQTSHVRFSLYNGEAIDGTSDFVWVQISLDIPVGASAGDGTYSGKIWIHFSAATVSSGT